MNSSFQTQAWVEPLSRREVEILRLISDGMSNYEISQRLLLSFETIKWYNKQIFSKLSVNNRTQAARKAVEYRVLDSQAGGIDDDRRQRDNLPSQLTSFVGRESEITEIKQLLKFSRLVVLTGPGGCGKSRLAVQVAAELSEFYRDGVWLVEIASVSEPAFVVNAIASALKINLSGDSSPTDVLARFLARKHLLLLLDNFEHMLEVSPLLVELLAASPQLTILATSRERLHLYGEKEYPVNPLSLPDLQISENKEQLLACHAIQLFIQRAQATQPGFSVNEDQLSSIARICVRLDGLPLAIELAASQVKSYPPEILSQLLEQGLDVLSGGPRDRPARQRTLHATIEWSYNLLSANEQKLFVRMAVFKGGSTLDGITQVCAQGLSGNFIKILGALVEKNMVNPRQTSDGELRYNMLETIHQYAAERLEASGEAEDMRILQANYLADLVEAAQKESFNATQEYWFGRLRDELDNLRSILAWSFNGNNPEHGFRLTAALQEFWISDGLTLEGRHWTDQALLKSHLARPDLLAGVLRSAGYNALALNETRKSKELLSQAVQLFQEQLDDRNTAWSLVFLGGTYDGNLPEVQQGIDLCKQALTLFRNQDDKPGLAYTLNMLGELERSQEDYDAAQCYYEDSLAMAVEMGARIREAIVLNNLSFIAYHRQNYRFSVELAFKILGIARELKSVFRQSCFIATIAGPAAVLGYPKLAAQLLGASSARFESLGISHAPVDQGELENFSIVTRNLLGEKAFLEAWQEGQSMTLQDAISLTLTEIDLGK